MNITKLKYHVDKHFNFYTNVSFCIAAIAGEITMLYYKICWWFFPPFILILLMFVLFNIFLYKFSK